MDGALTSALSPLLSLPVGVDGISWYTDSGAGRVVVTTDESVSAAELATPPPRGGTRRQRRCVSCGRTVCSVRSGARAMPSTVAATNSSQSTLIGPTTGHSFPGNDYALVRYDNTSLPHPGGPKVVAGSRG